MSLSGSQLSPGGSGPVPGVYFEEVFPPRQHAFATGIPVFVGFVSNLPERRRGHSPWFVLHRWMPELFSHRLFGPPVVGGYLAYALRGFFENGGRRCFVLPILHRDTVPGRAATELEKHFRAGAVLDDLEGADLVCVPDAALAEGGTADIQSIAELQRCILEYCDRLKDRFAILDAVPVHRGRTSAFKALRGADVDPMMEQRGLLGSGSGALYLPWLYVKSMGLRRDAAASTTSYSRFSAQTMRRDFGKVVAVPPSGHVAGVFARSDRRFGVHKAPANELVEGVIDLSMDLGHADQGRFNDVGVNCLCHIPGRGLRVWGARTLSSQPGWRYVNVRRVFMGLTRWIEENMKDLVFEPNGPPLWDRVRYRVGGYCNQLFISGALRGENADQAFFVKCDGETNTLDEREAGRLVAEIGLAVEVPAEFIIVRITKSVSGTEITGPGFVA